MLNERKKLRQWQAAQLRTLLYPPIDELILTLAEKTNLPLELLEEAAREVVKEVLEETINEDPLFRAFDEALAEYPDADHNAIWSLLELSGLFDDPDDPDEPMPRQVFVAPAVIIRRRSCQSSGRRSSGNGTGNGKGGGDGGNGDGDDDSNANSDNHIKINARAWTRAERR